MRCWRVFGTWPPSSSSGGEGCTDCIREFGLYRWDEKATMDRPIKENDHAMDDVRYFVHRIFAPDLFSF